MPIYEYECECGNKEEIMELSANNKKESVPCTKCSLMMNSVITNPSRIIMASDIEYNKKFK